MLSIAIYKMANIFNIFFYNRPVIVYNRLTVGAPASPASTTPSRRHTAREKTDTWYEYGCV